MPSTQMIFDRLAIGVSVLCAIHCAFLPILLVSFPSLLSIAPTDHEFHKFLVVIIVPLSASAAFLGCLRHKDKLVIAGAVTGLLVIIGACLLGHELMGELGEKLATVVGSMVLVASHWRNFALCRKNDCSDCC